MIEDPDFGIAAALELSVSESSLRSARREVETELAAAEPELGLDESFDVAATIDAATVTDAALADTQAALEAGLDPVAVDVEPRDGGLSDPLLAGGAGVGVGAVLEEDADPELVDDPGEQVAAALELSVSDSSLRAARREIEEGIGDVEADVALAEEPGIAATLEATVSDTAVADVQAELEDGLEPVSVGAAVDDVGASIPDGGESGLSLGGAGELALQQEQLEQLEEINEGVDDLEGTGGGGGLVGGAAGGAIGGLGGLAGVAVTAARSSALSLLVTNQASVAAGGDGAYQAGSLPEDVDASDLGPVEEFIADRASGVDLGLGRPLRPTFEAIDELLTTESSGPEDTQAATAPLGDRRNIPENITVGDLREDVREDLGLEDAEPGTAVDPGALLEQLDSVTSGFDGLVADLSTVSEDFLTASEDLAATIAALEDFPSSLASALPNRPETEDGELLPRSPVDRSEGEPGARGSGRPGGRGRLAPGPNAGGTRDIASGAGGDGQGTSVTNKTAEKKRQQQSVDVTNEITVEASGGGLTREQQQELERELDRFRKRLERRFTGR